MLGVHPALLGSWTTFLLALHTFFTNACPPYNENAPFLRLLYGNDGNDFLCVTISQPTRCRTTGHFSSFALRSIGATVCERDRPEAS